jgi:SAM-dependent methyltransferase
VAALARRVPPAAEPSDAAAGELDRETIMARAAAAQRAFYDDRFRHGYQRELIASGYDACILEALRWALGMVRAEAPAPPLSVLDYGCGRARLTGMLAEHLPDAAMTGADISPVALELAASAFPGAEYVAIEEVRVPLADRSFDLIVLADVIEHVADAAATAAELARLLRPGGYVIATTPCANAASIAWLFNALAGGFEPTPDGYGRFATDEPAHLRRLRSRDVRRLLADAGLHTVATRWWGHLFTALADSAPGLRELPLTARRAIATVDWRLLRWAPNGAAMVIVARHRQDLRRA